MANKQELVSVINALEFPQVGSAGEGGYFASSIENKDFQARAKEVWLPRIMANIRVNEGGSMNETMQQVLCDPEGRIVDFQFLSSHLISKHTYDTFDVYVGAMDLTFPNKPTGIACPQGKAVYETDVVLTVQFEVHVDRLNQEEFLSIINMLYTSAVSDDDNKQQIPLGTYSGFYQLKYQVHPHLYKGYGKTKAGKDLVLDDESMLYVTDEKKPKRVMSSLMYMLAYQNARFPDVRLLNIFEPPVEPARKARDITSSILDNDEELDPELMDGIEQFLKGLEKKKD